LKNSGFEVLAVMTTTVWDVTPRIPVEVSQTTWHYNAEDSILHFGKGEGGGISERVFNAILYPQAGEPPFSGYPCKSVCP
jgi:hypothetical protein